MTLARALLLPLLATAYASVPSAPPLPAMPCASVGLPYTACAAPEWVHRGPAGYTNMGDPLKMESAGAIQAVAGPTKTAGAYLVGSVNGGVWRTLDLAPHRNGSAGEKQVRGEGFEIELYGDGGGVR